MKIRILADREVRQQRLSLCYACEYNVDDKKCGKCGCHLGLKTQFKASKCPLNKW